MKIQLLKGDGYLVKKDGTWSLFKYNHHIRDLDGFESHFLDSVQAHYSSKIKTLSTMLDLLGGDK